ncbi:MAG: DUF4402 domain-containing protein [Desulfobulbaceae bacterium]|nr:DUF4402 domain-containing protein [Desulfobulbaceae bacterium]HIJ79202.1 DUF4402 domain-containing protein [Deltaproteobacteria bacterium]
MAVKYCFRAVIVGVFFMGVCFPLSLFAFTVDTIQPLSFGQVIADPTANETIEVDAQTGPATTEKTSSGYSYIVSGGNNGTIRINTGTSLSCSLLFPPSITLSGGGDTMLVDHFSLLSMNGGSTVGGILDLYIGGRMNIHSGQLGASYSGNVVVTVIIE